MARHHNLPPSWWFQLHFALLERSTSDLTKAKSLEDTGRRWTKGKEMIGREGEPGKGAIVADFSFMKD